MKKFYLVNSSGEQKQKPLEAVSLFHALEKCSQDEEATKLITKKNWFLIPEDFYILLTSKK